MAMPADASDIRGLAVTTMPGQRLDHHDHPWHQLFYAARGGMRVRAEETVWSVPPGRALWMPAHRSHEVTAVGRLAMRTLYVRPELWDQVPEEGRLIVVSPLLRELILHAVAQAPLSRTQSAHGPIVDLLGQLLSEAEAAPMSIPWPSDEKLSAIAESLQSDPADRRTVDEIAETVALSRRTLERRVRQTTGLSFQRWRMKFKAVAAIEALSSGASANEAMFAAGYNSPSAFIEMFRREVGMAPSKFSGATSDDRAGATAL